MVSGLCAERRRLSELEKPFRFGVAWMTIKVSLSTMTRVGGMLLVDVGVTDQRRYKRAIRNSGTCVDLVFGILCSIRRYH